MKKMSKNKKIIMVFILVLVAFIPLNVFAEVDYNNLCADSGVAKAMQIIGYVVSICKWIAPLIIIVLGMVDFGKAVISNDDKALSKATSSLIRRFIAGIAIFLIPTLIAAILNITIETDISNTTTTIGDTNFGRCTKCIFAPDSCVINN